VRLLAVARRQPSAAAAKARRAVLRSSSEIGWQLVRAGAIQGKKRSGSQRREPLQFAIMSDATPPQAPRTGASRASFLGRGRGWITAHSLPLP
jgi:hypothetical protein